MSTITETLEREALCIQTDTTTNGTTAEKYTPKTPGRYLGHIIDLEVTDAKFFEEKDRKGQLTGIKRCAHFCNLKVLVAPENADLTFIHRTNDGTETTHNGADYVGWKVKGGIARYLEPNKAAGDTFEANPGGNEDYLELCRVLGLHPETREINNNGTTITAHVLPVLTAKDAINRPITAIVVRARDWVDVATGTTKPAFKVKKVEEWTDGKLLVTDDLPF